MRVRTLVVVVLLLLVALFAGLNWAAFTAPTELWLGVATVRAPLGLILLAMMVFRREEYHHRGGVSRLRGVPADELPDGGAPQRARAAGAARARRPGRGVALHRAAHASRYAAHRDRELARSRHWRAAKQGRPEIAAHQNPRCAGPCQSGRSVDARPGTRAPEKGFRPRRVPRGAGGNRTARRRRNPTWPKT